MTTSPMAWVVVLGKLIETSFDPLAANSREPARVVSLVSHGPEPNPMPTKSSGSMSPKVGEPLNQSRQTCSRTVIRLASQSAGNDEVGFDAQDTSDSRPTVTLVRRRSDM